MKFMKKYMFVSKNCVKIAVLQNKHKNEIITVDSNSFLRHQ